MTEIDDRDGDDAERELRVPTRLGELHARVRPGRAAEADRAPAAVFWSSMFVDGTTWDRLLPLLPDRPTIVVDPPGLGRSEPLARVASIVEAADAATDLLAALREAGIVDERAVDWVGNAFGGHVGFELAVRPGVLRSLVAISSPPESLPASLRRKIQLLRPLLRALGAVGPVRSAVFDAMVTEASAADPRVREVVESSLSRPTRASLSTAVQSFILDRVDVTGHLARIDVPSLFVAGDERGDWTPIDARRAAASTPEASVVVIDGARTLVPIEQPTALAREIADFWARVDSAGARRR